MPKKLSFFRMKLSANPKPTLQRDWCDLHRHLVWIYEGKPEVTYRKGRYHNSKISAWLIRKGSIRVEGGGTTVEAGVGHWVFPPFGEDDRTFSDDLEILSLRCHARWPNGHMLFESPLPYSLPSRDLPQLEQAAMALLDLRGLLTPTTFNDFPFAPLTLRDFLRIEHALSAWLVPYVEAMERLGAEPTRRVAADARAAQVRARLDRLPLDRDMDAAKASGLGRSQLDRMFLANYGVTPRRYWEQRRLDAALAALEGSRQPIKEIAIGLGFRQYSHFSNWFKKQVGLSPRAVRQQALANAESP